MNVDFSSNGSSFDYVNSYIVIPTGYTKLYVPSITITKFHGVAIYKNSTMIWGYIWNSDQGDKTVASQTLSVTEGDNIRFFVQSRYNEQSQSLDGIIIS